MKKASNNYKEVKQLLEKKLQEGMSKHQVLEELSENYEDKNKLSKLIALSVRPEVKAKYKIYNNVLLGLLLLTIVVKLLSGILLYQEPSPVFTFDLVLLPILYIFFVFKNSQFDGMYYGILVLITLSSIFRSLANIEGNVEVFMFDLFVGFAIIVLSSFLKTGMFPHLGYLGPKKGADGIILLGE